MTPGPCSTISVAEISQRVSMPRAGAVHLIRPGHSAMSAQCPDYPNRSSLFDHLVGTGEQRRRHVEAECLGGLEVDHQLVLCRCLHRQVGGLLTPEDAIDIAGR